MAIFTVQVNKGLTAADVFCNRFFRVQSGAKRIESPNFKSSPVRDGPRLWLEIAQEQFAGTIAQLPVREDITLPIEEQLIVELYSR